MVFKTVRVAAMSAALVLAPIGFANAQSSGGSSAGNLADPTNPLNPDAPAVKSGSSGGGESAMKSDSGGKKKMSKKSGKKSNKKNM